ncbi:MAG: outer membrane beta-barrel protein [Henriciella sp.]
MQSQCLRDGPPPQHASPDPAAHSGQARTALVFCLVAAAGLPAAAQDKSRYKPLEETDNSGVYAAFRGYGAIHDQNNLLFDASREFGAAVGFAWDENWRVEAEYARRWAKISGINGAREAKGNFDSHTLGGHIFRDFNYGSRFRPFVGAGAGMGILDFEFSGPANINPDFIVVGDDTNQSFYWNAFLGVNYRLTDRLKIGAGVEYFTFEDQPVEANVGAPEGIYGINRSYNYFLSLRYSLTGPFKR